MNNAFISHQSKSFRNYKEICNRADILMLDYQARRYGNGFHHNAQVGKMIHGLLGWDKLIPESMAMYLNQGWDPVFRKASKPKEEAQMWAVSGMAGGIQPWWHHVGAYHEDRRMYDTIGPILRWHEENEEYLINRTPVASVGVVWSQKNMDFYGRNEPEILVDQPWQGVTEALMREQIPYLPIHIDQIEQYTEQLSLLILPNLGVMTDEQIIKVKRFVKQGGSLLATGQSSMFDEWGDPRPDYGLSELFGAHLKKQYRNHSQATKSLEDTKHTYLRLNPELRAQIDGPITGEEPPVTGDRHEVLQGFKKTDILPFGGRLDPLRIDSGAQILMTYIPPFPTYPPETAWMRKPKTDIPGLILNELPNHSRVAFMPADLGRQFSRNNFPDHANVLANLVKWTINDEIPFEIEVSGLVDCQIYKQENRMILHFLNLNNEGAWHEPIHELVPVGPLKARVKLSKDISGKTARLLVSNKKIPSNVVGNWIQFDIESILTHEVAVIS